MQTKKTILLLLALTSSLLAYTQNTCHSVFSGQVQDESNQPIIGATIVLLPGQTGQATDVKGNFRFKDLCPGKYAVKVQYLGYLDNVFEVDITGNVTRNILLKEDITELNEVVIVGHHDAAHTEHANNFVQLDEKQLAESAGKSLGEALKEVSGVNSIQTGPGIYKPVIHGVHSQRVLILNAGIRQEGQQWGAEHAPEIDPFMASNIVVIKDASAIKYGTDALGGVIVVNPPELPDEQTFDGTFQTALQSNGRGGTVSGMLEGGAKKGWGWRLQGTAKRLGDFHTPQYHLTNTGIRELNFSAATGYHSEHAGVDIFFSHFQTELGILKGTSIGNLEDLATAMERDVPLYTSGFSYKISEPHQEVSHNLLKVNGHLQTEHGEWEWQYGFQNDNRSEFDIRIGDLSKIPAVDLRLNTHTLDASWESKHSDRKTISVGINGMQQYNMNVPGTQRIPFIPDYNSMSAGLFGITKLYRNEWTIDLGARYDFRYYAVKGYDFKNTLYSTTFNFHNVSATAGATVLLDDNQTLNLNLSSAWRPPSVAELFSVGTHQGAAAIEYGLLLNDSSNEVMDLSDVSFKTEQAVKFVATYERKWEHLSVEVSPFANYIFNYIYLRPTGITKNVRGVYPYFRYTQTNALFLGADIVSTIEAGEHFKITPKISLLRASDERNNDYLVFIPSNKYELGIRYQTPSLAGLKNFYLESKTKYVSRQYRAPRVVTVREIIDAQEENSDLFKDDHTNFDFLAAPEGYWLWNLAGGISLKGKKTQYDFRISSENTLNQQYREYTNRFRYYADDMGRNITVSLKCIF